MSKPNITAVHDDDLLTFLKNVGILADLQAGRLHCRFCSTVVGFEDLHAVFPESGTIHVSCDRPTCVKVLMHHIAEK